MNGTNPLFVCYVYVCISHINIINLYMLHVCISHRLCNLNVKTLEKSPITTVALLRGG